MNAPFIRRWDGETLLVAVLSACLSLAALLFCWHRGYVLLFGDAVAHINIARRVFDSQTPGLLQLGTVWLPLPHLLMLPFILSLKAWHSGIGGSIPSMAAYVLGTIGIFRLVRGALSWHGEHEITARLAAWLAVAIYAGNPNLLYIQSTAMTEPLYLAFFVWSIVFFTEFAQSAPAEDRKQAESSLLKCGLCVAAAELTRYDGWFLAAALGAAAIFATWTRFGKLGSGQTRVRVPISRFILIISVAAILWLTYNAVIYRNPLEFANGPYSARAIETKTAVPGNPPHPGAGNLIVAAQYFVKAGELNLAEGQLQKFWVLAAIAGVVLSLAADSRLLPLLLLWVPLPFYALSVAYGSVPIFLPTWWPFSFYNVRYGTQLLPAVAVFVALAAYVLVNISTRPSVKLIAGGAMLGLIVASYCSVWRATPVCFREAWVNGRSRIALEKTLATQLAALPPDTTLLMYLGDHVGALQDASIPLRRTINEADHRTWKQPADADGLWERALADPARYSDFIIAIDSDPVATSIRQRSFEAMAIIDVSGQPRATIYRTGRNGR